MKAIVSIFILFFGVNVFAMANGFECHNANRTVEIVKKKGVGPVLPGYPDDYGYIYYSDVVSVRIKTKDALLEYDFNTAEEAPLALEFSNHVNLGSVVLPAKGYCEDKPDKYTYDFYTSDVVILKTDGSAFKGAKAFTQNNEAEIKTALICNLILRTRAKCSTDVPTYGELL